MKNWTSRLNCRVFARLCNCRTTKEDLPALIAAKWGDMKERGMDKRGYEKEDALVAILELLDENSVNIALTIAEYNELKRE